MMNLPPPHANWDYVSNLALSATDLDTVAGSSETNPAVSLVSSQVYPPDVALFQQGSHSQQVYFIERGLVKLNRVEQDGQQIIIGLRSSGWMLGTSAVILRKLNPVSATTLTSCHIRHISADAFRHLLKTDVQFSWYIQHSQSRETHEQINRIAQLSCLSARHRLEQLLWELTSALAPGDAKKDVKIEVPLKQWEIAQLIGVTPEHLCRMLRQLEDEGVLCRKKGWLIAKDAQKLWHSGDS
jgi:CRP/FNR family transcriptional regulator